MTQKIAEQEDEALIREAQLRKRWEERLDAAQLIQEVGAVAEEQRAIHEERLDDLERRVRKLENLVRRMST